MSMRHIRSLQMHHRAYLAFATFAALRRISFGQKEKVKNYATELTEESAGRRAAQEGAHLRDGLAASHCARHPTDTRRRAQSDATQDHH